MAGRFIDFDAARAERESEPLLLRACGRTFELPGSMPAALLLDLLRIREDSEAGDDVTLAQALGVLRRVIPADILDELTASDDFSAEDFTTLSEMVVRAYMGVDEPGEAPAPNREARRHQAAAKSPRSRGSRAGSTSPQKPKASPSRGPQSSSTGP